MLLTDDGRLADLLLQPGSQAQEKEYLVRVVPPLQPEQVSYLTNNDDRASACKRFDSCPPRFEPPKIGRCAPQ